MQKQTKQQQSLHDNQHKSQPEQQLSSDEQQQQQTTTVNHNHQQHSSQKQKNQQKYITDAHQYLKFCQNDKKIKIMDEQNPILPHIYLKDISLHKKGPLQDKLYSKNNIYYCNIRRGNTLCQIYDQNQKQIMMFMCRRGMKKFYDLQPQYLKINRKLTHQHQRYRKRIFQYIDQVIGMDKNKIHLYGLFKQNGQHCQISYIQELKYWLFASKNVAILARNQSDLENNYQKQRFYWAKLIGQQFFKTIAHLTPQQIQQFIKDINGKTLLGQHCGYEQHQHITKYQKIQLIFYGLVQNNGVDHCLPVEQCQKFLQKYSLKMSKMEKIQNLTQKNKIYFSMYKMLKRIAQGTMDQCGEGSVLYIVSQNQQGVQKTVGMCKLKTCQYLIYRKLRQMIKIYFAKKGATSNNYMKFKFQIENLCGSYFKPPKPLQYYFQIANQAFKEVKNNGKDFSDDQFRYKFVQFLDNMQKKSKARKQMQQNSPNMKQQIRRIILVCLPLTSQQSSLLQKSCKKYNFQTDYSYRQSPPNSQSQSQLTKSILHILHMVPRMNLNELQNNTTILIYQSDKNNVQKIITELENQQDLKKAHLITFIKSGDKRKSVELLRDKINGFGQACIQANKQQKQKQNRTINLKIVHNIKQIVQNIENQSKTIQKNQQQLWQQQQNQKSNKNMINIILTMLIPGSGKSSLAEYIQQNYCDQNIKFICSDKIRQAVMEKLKGKRKDQVDIQHLYANTKKKGLEKYLQAVKQAIGEQAPQRNTILFIDRVFCPTTILQNIQKQLHRPWTKFTIVTQTQIPTKLNDFTYPHSLNYLLGCIKRCLQRQEHQTLTQKPAQIIKVILKFYQMYRNFTYNRLIRQLDQQNIQAKIVQLEFVKEDQQQVQNLFLKRKIQQCLKGISPGFDAPQSGLYTQLIELMYKYSQHIQRKNTEENQVQKGKMVANNAEKLMKICLNK